MELPITKTEVEASDRLGFPARHLGRSAHIFEARAFSIMQHAAIDYSGGYWDFFDLSNGGFFIAPPAPLTDDGRYVMFWPGNGFEDLMSAEATGIAVCLMAMGNMMFESGRRVITEKFFQLRDYGCGHAEADLIEAFID